MCDIDNFSKNYKQENVDDENNSLIEDLVVDKYYQIINWGKNLVMGILISTNMVSANLVEYTNPNNLEIGEFRNLKKFEKTEKKTSLETVKRKNDIVSMGDTHGNFEAFISNLKISNLIDDGLNWIGGNTDLILHGDILGDRNLGSLDTLIKIYDLQKQAEKVGGSITILAGNHEDAVYGYFGNINMPDGAPFNYLFGESAKGTVEFDNKFGSRQNFSSLKRFIRGGPMPTDEILKNMKKSEEGVKILDVMTNYKILEQIDDTLYCHTDFTSEMAMLLGEYGIKKINNIYQKGLRDILLNNKKPSKEYLKIRDIFLNSDNREYLKPMYGSMLKNSGINRIIHGHSNWNKRIVTVGGIEIYSVDTNFGSNGKLEGQNAIAIFRKDGTTNIGLTEPKKEK